MFNDAVFYLFQAIMIRIQHCARMCKVKVILRLLRPRQIKHTFNVVAHLRLLMRASGQIAEAVDFFFHRFAQFLRHILLFKAFQERIRLRLIRFAQLRADGFHLLAQIVFLLVFIHPAFDFLRNASIHAQDLNFIQHERKGFAQAFRHVKAFQHALPLLHLAKRYIGNCIRKRPRILRARNALRSICRELGGKGRILPKCLGQAAA